MSNANFSSGGMVRRAERSSDICHPVPLVKGHCAVLTSVLKNEQNIEGTMRAFTASEMFIDKDHNSQFNHYS